MWEIANHRPTVATSCHPDLEMRSKCRPRVPAARRRRYDGEGGRIGAWTPALRQALVPQMTRTKTSAEGLDIANASMLTRPFGSDRDNTYRVGGSV